ncbi:MAG TPA: hypothetical protein GXZ27_02630, partial [Thermoanaerobacterales bacterium]|nr:hypothetical protein [Thermoanaerobacterales bacterium]
MSILEKIFLRVLYSSLTATVVVLLILFLKKVFKDKFTPRFHYILWVLVLIRLLIPYAPESNLSLFNILPNNTQNLSFKITIPKSKEIQPLATKQVSNVNKTHTNFIEDTEYTNHKNLLPQDKLAESKEPTLKDQNTNIFQRSLKLLSCIWAIGVLLMTLSILIAALKFRKDAKSFDKIKCPNTTYILNNCKEKLKLSKSVELFCGNDYNSPFIFGVLKPGIYLPRHILTKVNNEELSYILLHELSHYKRGGLLYNLLSTVAITLHWFNPIMWFAMKQMKADIEYACDSYVLENLEDSDSVHYGMTIIKLSSMIFKPDHNKMLYAHFHEGKGQIERRIVLIKMFKKGSYKLSAIALIFFIVLGTCTLTNAQTDIDKVATLEPTESIKIEQFYFENSFKVFYTLERALDFIDFEFKVPDKKPTDYEFDKILLDEEKGLASVGFTKVNDDKHISVHILTSKKDLIEHFKEEHLNYSQKINEKVIKPDVKFAQEVAKISDIEGIYLTVHKNWEWEEEDLAEIREENTEEVTGTGLKVKTMRILPKEEIDKYFIWQDDNIWYCISLYNRYTDIDSKFVRENEISMDEMNILISSFKYPKELQNAEYISRKSDRFLEIYDDKDLETAR